MQEKIDKQTITNTNDASAIQKNNPKKAVPTGDRQKFGMLLKKIKSASTKARTMSIQFMYSSSPDGVVVRALRCGRGNKGSNPGPDR